MSGSSNVGKRAGRYTLASMPKVGPSPVPSIVTCLGRRSAHRLTENFYTIKILTIKDPKNETYDERQGKMLLHTEYSLLSLLHGQKGVVHVHDFFQDEADEEANMYGELGSLQYTGRTVTRYCLVLDCLVHHDYSERNNSLINLQHYVIKEKKLAEKEALTIFINIVKTVSDLHKLNIVHRDLKLGNMILDRTTNAVTITNFCLGKLLISDDDVVKDQRGSPAYISPEVLAGLPYKGKPSDIWALGVVLYTMLYGQFPFYDQVPQELFKKIKAVHYDIPNDGRVSPRTKEILRKLLTYEADSRYTASQLHSALQDHVSQWQEILKADEDQLVPESTVQVAAQANRPSVIQRHASKTLSDIERFLYNSDREEHASGLADNLLVPSFEDSNKERMGLKRKAPPIRRLSEDARLLSSIEMDMYRSEHVIHTPTPSTSAVRPFNSDSLSRKLLNQRKYKHPTSKSLTDSLQRSMRSTPMTPTTLTPRIPLLTRGTIPRLDVLPADGPRFMYTRSFSQPAGVVRARAATHVNDSRLLLQQLASRMHNTSENASSSQPL